MNIWRKKDVTSVLDENEHSSVTPTMSTFDLVLFGVGAIIGSGIMVLTGIASAEAGPAVIFSFLIAGAACGLAGLCYAEMASTVPSSGSTYTYTYLAVGELVAHCIGWVLVGGYILTAATIASGWSGYFTSLLNGFGIHLSKAWLTIPANGGYGNYPAMLVVLLITALLSRGTSSSKFVDDILVLIKVGIIILFIVVGAFFIHPINWTAHFAPSGFSGVMGAATTVFFTYLGFDAISTSAEDAKNPQQSLPRAIIITLVVCTLLYMVVCLVMTGVVPYSTLGHGDALAFVMRSIHQGLVAEVISFGAVIGLMAGILSFVYASVRISNEMATDGLLPMRLAKRNSNGVPVYFTWGVGILTALLTAYLPLTQLADLANVASILAFTLVCYATIAFRKRYPELPRGFAMPAVPFLPILAIIIFISLLWSIKATTWLIFLAWLAIGLVIYFAYSYRHSRLVLMDSEKWQGSAQEFVDDKNN